MKPLTRRETDLFSGCVAESLTEVPEECRMVLAAHEEDGATLLALGSEESVAAVDQLTARKPRALAAALRVAWAQLPEEDTEPAWLLIVVVPGRSAQFTVRRDTESSWWRIKPPEAPWLALSTASSLRASLEEGKPLTIKSAQDERLFSKVTDGTPPPVDEKGFI